MSSQVQPGPGRAKLSWLILSQDIKHTLGCDHVKLSWVDLVLGRVEWAQAQVESSQLDTTFSWVLLDPSRTESNQNIV